MPEIEVKMDDGTIAKTNLPADKVADLQPKAAEPAADPAKDPNPAPEPPAKPADAQLRNPKAEKPKEPEAPPQRPGKAKPIANLLAKNHDLEAQLEAERTAKADLEAKLAAAAQKPAGTEATADIKALAAKHGLDEGILADIVATARAGFKTELPKDVQDLLAERAADKQLEAEQAGFDADVASLQRTFKDEPFSDPKVLEKLAELAYSEDKAPDGEPYFKKPLHELYFTFIKPEIQPGKPSAEPSRGGAASGTTVIDFQDIFDRDDPKDIDGMDGPTFKKYSTWLKDKAGNPPIKRANQS